MIVDRFPQILEGIWNDFGCYCGCFEGLGLQGLGLAEFGSRVTVRRPSRGAGGVSAERLPISVAGAGWFREHLSPPVERIGRGPMVPRCGPPL